MNDEVTKEKPEQNGSETDKTATDKASKDKHKVDWVTGRSNCSLPKIFKELRSQVSGDIQTRNALRPPNSPYEFFVRENGADFAAVLETKGAHRSVTFSLAEHAIVVRDDDGKPMFEVTLTLNDLGECKLYVKEEERELWQVRRMALEELLFMGY